MNKLVLALVAIIAFSAGVMAAPLFETQEYTVEMDADGICPKATSGISCG